MRHDTFPLMLFAAGRGTRMKALTKSRPKPLVEVAGRSLLSHALGLGQAAGAAPIVANAHYLGQQIEDALAGEDVAISREEVLLDTGGGLRAARPLLGEGPVWTLNSDAIWTGPNPLQALAAAWDPDRMDALLLLVPPAQAEGTSSAGDFALAPDGRLSRGPGYIYTGAQILRPDGLSAIGEDVFSLNVLWDKIAAEGRLHGIVFPGGWCDVGRPEGIALAEAMLERTDA
ncbi:nucleotidyltransferase family protein [Tropicimonas sp. IMCC34011]|uniref:nucleotidyltransferase family protein n=1 Tax=Tropicimonas sp. IMCC34011 TaxID=2248759 RepID=UPI001E3A3F64|nr:nucleotidyltransferase family protein [Tropicimonas sp. IMCC34011]